MLLASILFLVNALTDLERWLEQIEANYRSWIVRCYDRGESRLAARQPRADKEITNRSNASATNFVRSRVFRSEQVADVAISHSARSW